MIKPTIAFLYNLQHSFDPQLPQTFREADADDPKTITAMIKHFKNLNAKIIPLEADQTIYSKLQRYKNQITIAFNYTVGRQGKDHYAHIPAILEMLQIPYTGSPPLTQALISNKVKAKQIMQAFDIPTLPFQVFHQATEELQPKLTFPLLVKPINTGSSSGITKDSVVTNRKTLQTQLAKLITIFNEPVYAEPFLAGREFSIALLGNPPQILPIAELNHSCLPQGLPPLATMEVKNDLVFDHTKYFLCPAQIGKPLQKKLEKICLQVWQTFEILDWCRIDIRCDGDTPYVLEINSPASLEPPETTKNYCTFPNAAQQAGYSYGQLLAQIIDSAAQRYNISWR